MESLVSHVGIYVSSVALLVSVNSALRNHPSNTNKICYLIYIYI